MKSKVSIDKRLSTLLTVRALTFSTWFRVSSNFMSPRPVNRNSLKQLTVSNSSPTRRTQPVREETRQSAVVSVKEKWLPSTTRSTLKFSRHGLWLLQRRKLIFYSDLVQACVKRVEASLKKLSVSGRKLMHNKATNFRSMGRKTIIFT